MAESLQANEQMIAPRLDFSLPPEQLGARVQNLVAAARQNGAILSIEAIGKATVGRVVLRVTGEFAAAYNEWVAERLMA